MFNELCKICFALGSYKACEIIENMECMCYEMCMFNIANSFMLSMCDVHFDVYVREYRNTS